MEGKRPDVQVVAQGLAGSPWYQADWRRRDPSLNVGNLREPEGWRALGAGGRAVLATQDTELPAGLAAGERSRGLLLAVSPSAPADDGGLWALMVRRDRRRYGETPDFFASDLIQSRATAYYRRGQELQKAGRPQEARERFLQAWSMQWVFPDVPLMLGYMSAVSLDWAEAAAEYDLAGALFAEKLSLAMSYRALPDVRAGLRRQAAEAVTHRGVCAERQGRREEAFTCYQRALLLSPLAQTRFNLAVLAWGKDWDAAEADLVEALRLDPGHAEARKYLAVLRARRLSRPSGGSPR